MSSAAQKRHYRVVQRDKQSESESDLLSTLKAKEIALLGGTIYFMATLMSFFLGYLLGKKH